MTWQEHGRCRDIDPELFYPPLEYETPRQRSAREAAAKAVCNGCPVRGECLAWALAADERLGVWGGLSERERQMLTAHRRRPVAHVAVR